MRSIAPVIVTLLALAVSPGTSSQSERLVYDDPKGRFTFSYPAAFGGPSKGTNDGFADRAAAIRFATFSAEGAGGELVVTHGPPALDLQAAGGLYDSIAREALPERWRQAILAQLPRVTPANACGIIEARTHLDPTAPGLAPIPAPQRARLADLDRLGNVDPVLDRCDVRDDVAVFQKTARFTDGAPRRSIYGAVRFVAGRYSSVQIIRAGTPPSSSLLDEMRQVVTSWRPERARD